MTVINVYTYHSKAFARVSYIVLYINCHYHVHCCPVVLKMCTCNDQVYAYDMYESIGPAQPMQV